MKKLSFLFTLLFITCIETSWAGKGKDLLSFNEKINDEEFNNLSLTAAHALLITNKITSVDDVIKQFEDGISDKPSAKKWIINVMGNVFQIINNKIAKGEKDTSKVKISRKIELETQKKAAELFISENVDPYLEGLEELTKQLEKGLSVDSTKYPASLLCFCTLSLYADLIEFYLAIKKLGLSNEKILLKYEEIIESRIQFYKDETIVVFSKTVDAYRVQNAISELLKEVAEELQETFEEIVEKIGVKLHVFEIEKVLEIVFKKMENDYQPTEPRTQLVPDEGHSASQVVNNMTTNNMYVLNGAEQSFSTKPTGCIEEIPSLGMRQIPLLDSQKRESNKRQDLTSSMPSSSAGKNRGSFPGDFGRNSKFFKERHKSFSNLSSLSSSLDTSALLGQLENLSKELQELKQGQGDKEALIEIKKMLEILSLPKKDHLDTEQKQSQGPEVNTAQLSELIGLLQKLSLYNSNQGDNDQLASLKELLGKVIEGQKKLQEQHKLPSSKQKTVPIVTKNNNVKVVKEPEEISLLPMGTGFLGALELLLGYTTVAKSHPTMPWSRKAKQFATQYPHLVKFVRDYGSAALVACMLVLGGRQVMHHYAHGTAPGSI